MDDFRIWLPLDDVEKGRYLYHYTTYSAAIKILFYQTLRFSRLCRTNDAFEQRPKIKCYNDEIELAKMFRLTKKLFQRQQDNIRLLCFSMDPDIDDFRNEYQEMKQYLSKDQIRQNVNGRGFALPRMWAQYAGNNTGICLVFDNSTAIRCTGNWCADAAASVFSEHQAGVLCTGNAAPIRNGPPTVL